MRRCGIYIGPAMAEKLVRHGVTGVKDLVGKAQVGELKKNRKKIGEKSPSRRLAERTHVMSWH